MLYRLVKKTFSEDNGRDRDRRIDNSFDYQNIYESNLSTESCWRYLFLRNIRSPKIRSSKLLSHRLHVYLISSRMPVKWLVYLRIQTKPIASEYGSVMLVKQTAWNVIGLYNFKNILAYSHNLVAAAQGRSQETFWSFNISTLALR